jgi:hypothetical protein
MAPVPALEMSVLVLAAQPLPVSPLVQPCGVIALIPDEVRDHPQEIALNKRM